MGPALPCPGVRQSRPDSVWLTEARSCCRFACFPLLVGGLPPQGRPGAANVGSNRLSYDRFGSSVGCRRLIHRLLLAVVLGADSYRVKAVFECLVCFVMPACAGSPFPRVPLGRLLSAQRHTGGGRPWPAAAICAACPPGRLGRHAGARHRRQLATSITRITAKGCLCGHPCPSAVGLAAGRRAAVSEAKGGGEAAGITQLV